MIKKFLKHNSGLSLVELIVVISIMAVLTGFLAPTLVHQIKKQREESFKNDASKALSTIESLGVDSAVEDYEIAAANIQKVLRSNYPSASVEYSYKGGTTAESDGSYKDGRAAVDAVYFAENNRYAVYDADHNLDVAEGELKTYAVGDEEGGSVTYTCDANGWIWNINNETHAHKIYASLIENSNGVTIVSWEYNNKTTQEIEETTEDTSGGESGGSSDPVTASCKVTFSTNGKGTFTNGNTSVGKNVSAGSTVTAPSDPEAEGHTFSGWYTDTSCTAAYDFSAAVSGDFTLYAKWTPLTYTITWKDHAGSVLATDTVYYGIVPSYNRADPDPYEDAENTYTFTGWTPSVTAVTGDMTYTAVYTKTPKVEYCTVKFVNYNGSVLQSSEVVKGATPSYTGTEPTKPSDTNYKYVFAGWNPSVSVVTTDTVYTAQYTQVSIATPSYTVNFYNNGHGTAPESQTVIKGWYATEPTAPTADHYDFGGWYLESSCKNKYNFSTAVTGNVNLYAKWTEKTKYTVTFYKSGKSAYYSQTVYAGECAIDPGAPDSSPYSSSYYYFVGWRTSSNGSTLFDFTTPITGDLKLYEYWVSRSTKCTVYFNSNGHGSDSSETVYVGETVSSKTPTAKGWIFGGWYRDSSCSTAYDFTKPVTSTLYLYALWTKDPNYNPTALEILSDYSSGQYNAAISALYDAGYYADTSYTYYYGGIRYIYVYTGPDVSTLTYNNYSYSKYYAYITASNFDTYYYNSSSETWIKTSTSSYDNAYIFRTTNSDGSYSYEFDRQ